MTEKTIEELMDEKLSNLKKYVTQKIEETNGNKENEYYIKLMSYGVDDIIFFSRANIIAYKTVGMDIVIQSFCAYLELKQDDSELKEKIKRYFDFFREVLEL